MAGVEILYSIVLVVVLLISLVLLLVSMSYLGRAMEREANKPLFKKEKEVPPVRVLTDEADIEKEALWQSK